MNIQPIPGNSQKDHGRSRNIPWTSQDNSRKFKSRRSGETLSIPSLPRSVPEGPGPFLERSWEIPGRPTRFNPEKLQQLPGTAGNLQGNSWDIIESLSTKCLLHRVDLRSPAPRFSDNDRSRSESLCQSRTHSSTAAHQILRAPRRPEARLVASSAKTFQCCTLPNQL